MSCFDLAEAVSLLSEDSASGSAPSVDEESLFLLLEEMDLSQLVRIGSGYVIYTGGVCFFGFSRASTDNQKKYDQQQ